MFIKEYVTKDLKGFSSCTQYCPMPLLYKNLFEIQFRLQIIENDWWVENPIYPIVKNEILNRCLRFYSSKLIWLMVLNNSILLNEHLSYYIKYIFYYQVFLFF